VLSTGSRIVGAYEFCILFSLDLGPLCEQGVVIIAGAIKVMGRSISKIELLCQGCWGMQGSVASQFYLLELIQCFPFKM